MPHPHRTTERFVFSVAALVVVGALLGSLWVVDSSTTPDKPRIDADVAERHESIDGVDGTRTTTIERNGTVESERTYAVRSRPGTGERRLALVEGTATRYDTRISNGSVLWLYDRSENAATRLSLTGVPTDSTRGDGLARLFARLDATGTAPDGAPTVEPLPVVPQSGAAQPAVARGAGRATLDVRYVGTGTVADRDVHVLRIAPSSGAADDRYEQTLWIDAERFFPLKQRTAWTDAGERTVLTTTYAGIEFDPGLDDGVFEPDFPVNATVRTPVTPETETYRQIGALRAATNVSVPEPDVPASFELTYATRTTGSVRGVGLRFVNSTSRLTVAKYDFTHPASDGDEHVTVDGRTGSLTRGSGVTLSWNCDSYRHTIRGEGVAADLVVDVGRSVGCPGGQASYSASGR